MTIATHRGGRRRAQPEIGPGPGPGHGHSHGPAPDLDIARGPRIIVVALLVLAGVAVVVGVVGLWPDRSQVDQLGHSLSFAGPGVTFPHATVVSVNPCPPPRSGCDTLTVRVDGGGRATLSVGPDVIGSGLGGRACPHHRRSPIRTDPALA